MNELLISQFIDDEMTLDEKVSLIESLRDNREFADEALALVHQEQALTRVLKQKIPERQPCASQSGDTPRHRTWWQFLLPPAAGFAAALAVLALGLLLHRGSLSPNEAAKVAEYRFAVYLPQASQARIIGSFTDWAPLPMQKVGNSGYWTLTIRIPPGEHRYSYEVDGTDRLADPSVAAREQDDFGGENSVISIGGDDAPVS